VGLYREVRTLNVREVVYSPGLGYVPVVVTGVRVLSEAAVEAVERYAGVAPREVYTYTADSDYVEALRRSGLSVEPYSWDREPVWISIYGAGAYVVKKGGRAISGYPLWGYYNGELKRAYVYEPLAESLPLVVHEAAHYAIDILGLEEELKEVEEWVARLCELLAARGAPPIPPGRLVEILRNEDVVWQLERLSEAFGVFLGLIALPRNLAAFRAAVGLAMKGSVGAEVVSGILRGELCTEGQGLAFTLTKCGH